MPHPILEGRFDLAEHKRNIWFATAASGTTIEDLLLPDYWTHVAKRLTPYDVIEVASDDDAFFVTLLVVEVTRTAAALIEMQSYNLKSAEKPEVDDASLTLMVRWRGPHDRYCVMLRANSEVVKKGFNQKLDALSYIHNSETVRA